VERSRPKRRKIDEGEPEGSESEDEETQHSEKKANTRNPILSNTESVVHQPSVEDELFPASSRVLSRLRLANRLCEVRKGVPLTINKQEKLQT